MRLHENIKLFKEAVRFTAQQKGIQTIYIEKDYWIVYVLHHLFNSELKAEIIFKGGTSLSKCFNIIGVSPFIYRNMILGFFVLLLLQSLLHLIANLQYLILRCFFRLFYSLLEIKRRRETVFSITKSNLL